MVAPAPGPAGRKTRWPELVGWDLDDAAEKIKEEQDDVRVICLHTSRLAAICRPSRSCTCYYRLQHRRIWYPIRCEPATSAYSEYVER